MPDVLTDTTIRERRVRIRLPWADVRDLLTEAAAAAAGVAEIDRYNVKVDLKPDTEGSPAYSTGRYTGYVDIVVPEA